MAVTYTPSSGNAKQDAFAGVPFDDPTTYSAAANKRVDSKFFLVPVQDELLALLKSRVASSTYSQAYTCLAALAVGDPAYIDSANHVAKANAATLAASAVVGFVRHKGSLGAASDGSATSCYLQHFIYVSGLSGLTAGGDVFLTDAGGYSATAGTITRRVGRAISTTEALLCVVPLADQENRLLTSVEPSTAQRVLRGTVPFATGTTALTTSGTAYFTYLGRTVKDIVPKYVEFYVSTGGSGTQTAEVGLFSSPAAPNKGTQSLSKLVATGTVDDLTTTGVKRNTSAFATTIPAGTHLWAGIRTALATTQPTLWQAGPDMSQGNLLTTAAAGVLTGTGPWSGLATTVNNGPELRATLD